MLLSLLPLLGGTIGGWLLTLKLAGSKAASEFLALSAVIVPAILATEIICYLLARSRVRYQMYYGASLGAALIWFMMCIFLSLLWVRTIEIYIKATIMSFTFILCVCNYHKGYRYFDLKWRTKGFELFAKFFNSKENSIDWENVTAPLRLRLDLYVPGIPVRLSPLIAILCVPSMIIGFACRTAYPVFSIFALGIPAGIVVSVIAQMMGIWCSQASKIVKIERESNTKIKPKIRRG